MSTKKNDKLDLFLIDLLCFAVSLLFFHFAGWCPICRVVYPVSGYMDPDDTEVYPYRAFGMGRRESFQAIMKVFNSDLDRFCGGAFEGL